MKSASKGNPLVANISWSLLGNLIYALCQWGMLVVLAKLGTVTMVGEFSLGLAVTAPVMMFFNLQLRNVLATDSQNEFLFASYFNLRLVTSCAFVLVVLSFLLFLPYHFDLKIIILFIGLSKAFESISDLCYGLFQQSERLDYIAKSMIFRGILGVSAVWAGVYFTGSLYWGVALLTLAWCIVLLSYDFPIATSISRCCVKELLGEIDWTQLKAIVLLALPLGFVEMLASFNLNAPRYSVEHFIGIDELGLYSGMAYFMVAGVTVIYACGQSFLPRLAILFAENNIVEFRYLYRKLFLLILIVGIAGILGAYFWGDLLLRLFYSQEFSGYRNVFTLIMFSAAISFLATGAWFVLTAMRRFKVQILLFGFSLSVNIILCVILIPVYGLDGAALAFAAGEAVRFLFGLALICKGGMGAELPLVKA